MKLIVITSPVFFVEEDKIITTLFEEGLDILHLRKPHTEAIYAERLLSLIPAKYHKHIITHEHFYLQEEHQLKGIHLSERNKKAPNRYKGHISCSCTSVEEVIEKKNDYDYLFLKYLYEHDEQGGHLSTFSAEEIRKAAKDKIIDNQVMAFGGITPENILEVKDFGFGGAVIMNDIWNKFDPCTDRHFNGIISHFKMLKEMAD